MRRELQGIVAEFEAARERLHALRRMVPDEEWSRRPDPAQWSISECVAHLNLTSAACLPLLRDGLARARGIGGRAPRRYRRDLIGWMLWKASGPPARLRSKTTAPFVPNRVAPVERLVSEFDRLQEEQIACVREADGLPLQNVKIVSPFDPRISYNMFSALSILPRHQHRHLWQAEQAVRSVGDQ